MNINRCTGAALLATVCVVCPGAAQSLTGVITAADSGGAMAGATVVAVKKSTLPSQPPTIYQSVVDSDGHFVIAASPGPYALCVHAMPQSLYLDPCQWGNPATTTVGATAAAVPVSLQKGVRFIVRVHDTKQLLSQAEVVQGTAVSVSLSAPSVKLFPVPVVSSNGIVRDYGTVIPINVPMSVTISSSSLLLADKTGTPLSALAMPFQVLPTDIEVTGAPLSPATRMSPPPDARMVHVYAIALTSVAK